jgi:phosphate:Na+ symporter
LLIWGLRMVRTGIMRAYGASLRHRLTAALRNRVAGLLAGLAVTVALQSSTATSLMAASFVSRRIVGDMAVLAITLGAGIGTSLVSQALSFDVLWIGPLFILVGVIGFLGWQSTRLHDVARAAIGIGLILLALHQIGSVAGPIGQSAAVQTLLESLGGEPLIAVLVVAGLTLLTSSSIAMVLLIMSLASQGAVTPHLALLMVIGANLGAALPPLLGTGRSEPAARRAPLANFLFRLVVTVLALLLLVPVQQQLAALDAQPARMVANFHTLFNMVIAVLFLPLIGPASALMRRLLPDKAQPDDEGQPRYLDPAALEVPSVAIASAARETLRQGDVVGEMLRDALAVFRTDDRKLLKEVERMDNVVDRLHEAIKLFMTRVSRESLDPEDSRRCVDVLTFTTNLEHIGDIIDKNLMELAAKKIKHKLVFSAEGFAEICAMHARLMDNLALALNVFMSGDARMARRLLEEKVQFRDMERAASDAHMARLASGRPESVASSSLHLDIIRDLKRINSHLTSVAYPILDAAGELTRTRLKGAAVSVED